MAQVPATFYQSAGTVNYTPGSAVTGGDVVVVGNRALIAKCDIASGALGALASDGVFKVPKTTAAWTVGLPVYWDAAGNPDNGTAASGAASQIAGGVYMGIAWAAAGSGDDLGIVELDGGAKASIVLPSATVAAAGSTQADAALIAEGFTLVSGADATKGVLLPTARAGAVLVIKNGAAAILKLWPATSDAINALGANNSMSIAANTSVILVAYDATTWYTTPLLPS